MVSVVVSVPFRGFLFLTIAAAEILNDIEVQSFRPLPGIFVFNIISWDA